jgi:signal transduction histidine kinase
MSLPKSTPDFRNLFESAPALYLVLSPKLEIVCVSNAYLMATKTSRDEIVGRIIFDVFPDNPDDPTATGVGNLRASLHRVLENKVADTMAVQKYDIPIPASEGGGFEERYWSPINTPVFGASNQIEYIIHKVEDVTEFIKLKQRRNEQDQLTEELKSKADTMETEVFKRAQEIQEANQKLREAEKAKSEFFANVSHELRTPLSLILAPLESIQSGKYGAVPEKHQKFLQTIHNNAIRLLQLVNGILDFAKYEAGKMKVRLESTNAKVLLRAVLNDFESMLRGKKIELVYDIDSVDRLIMTDRYLLERIMFNLLSNAAKFTEEGGNVRVTADWQNDILTVSVQDTGIGIPENETANLFKKFNQIEGSSTRRFEGTGLGLAMVKEFSELLGGSVHVQSATGVGSTFTFTCAAPVTIDEPLVHTGNNTVSLVPKYKVEATEESTIAPNDSSFLKVLVCEDNEELRIYIVSLLQDMCHIKTANNGVTGLQLVASWKPDLVISDVMMPEKDGISVCIEIKSNPDTAKIMVVLLTALTHRDAMLKGWEAKADEYLFKPFHPEELRTRIASLLTIIKERRESDYQLELKNDQLTKAYSDMESFSYSVSHDLRAPLRSINGFAHILKDDHIDAFNDKGEAALNAIFRNVSRMNDLIEGLLALSRYDRKVLERSEVNTNQLVRSIINEISRTTEHKAVIKVHELMPASADRTLLYQVWTNLISNAIKYSSKKLFPEIEIGCSQGDGEVIYYVKDNGSGFNMEYANKLFGTFQRLHGVSEFEGTGIGLAIVKRIISKHGGRVWAEGKVGEGAVFYFSLPV